MVEEVRVSHEVAKMLQEKGFKSEMWYPSQSLVQKWLREVHKIHIEINWFLDNTWEYWLVSDHLEDEEDDLTYNSYEEALEKGLFEALSIIK